MKQVFFFILITISTQGFSCLSANQFKIYPVGSLDENIITIEADIHRTENRDSIEVDIFSKLWIIRTSLTIYDQCQQIQKTIALDSFTHAGEDYLESLSHYYTKGYNRILFEYPDINLFEVEYLSCCDYQHDCHDVKIEHDSIKKQNYLYIQKTNKQVPIQLDTSKAFIQHYHITEAPMYINSVLKYHNSEINLMLVHLGTGHEIYLREKYKDDKDFSPYPIEEQKPVFSKRSISQAIYIEPILHHGFGFDVFELF